VTLYRRVGTLRGWLAQHLRSARRQSVDILIYGDPGILVFFMGTGAIFWGLLLVLPLGTFQSTNSFDLMEKYAPAWVWGGSMMTAGVVKLATLFFSKRSWIKALVNFIFFVLWSFVAVSFIIANPAGTSTTIYPFFALASLWLAVRRYVQWLGGR
jgi:hypothetical protein